MNLAKAYKSDRLPRHCVYGIRNRVNGKIYVGSTSRTGRRRLIHAYALSAGKHYNRALQGEWDEYGCENFVFEILQVVKAKNLDGIRRLEQNWINRLHSDNPAYGYNIAPAFKPVSDQELMD